LWQRLGAAARRLGLRAGRRLDELIGAGLISGGCFGLLTLLLFTTLALLGLEETMRL